MRRLILSAVLCLFGLSGAAAAPIAFFDGFDDPTLDPAWTVRPGVGDFSLTAQPGRLQYELTGSTDPTGDATALWLHRPFDGTDWVFNTQVDYNLPPGNGRQLLTRILFGDLGAKGITEAFFFRDKDVDRDSIVAVFIDAGLSQGFTIAPADSFYFQVLRSGQDVVVQGSSDGIVFSDIFSRTYTTPLGSQQTLLLSGASFAAGQGGTAAYDFVSVTAVPEPSTAVLLGLGFVAIIGFTRAFIPFEICPAGQARDHGVIDDGDAPAQKASLCNTSS